MLLSTQISTLILKVDLACHKCYNKIRKILCSLQDQERITTISYDTKNNIVVIAGTFDPQRLCCRIRCKGGKVIKDTHIVDSGAALPPPKMADFAPPPMTSSPPPAKNSGKKKKWKKDKHKENIPPSPPPEHFRPPPMTSPPHQPPPPPENMRPPSPPPENMPAPQILTVGPAIVEEEKHHERPAELEPPSPPHKERPPSPVMEKPPPPPPMYKPPPAVRPCYPIDMTTTTMVEIPSWPAAPCYQGCYEGCRCGSCGRVYGYSVPSARPPPLIPPPATATCYGGGGGVPYCGGYSGCRIVNEEDPTACAIM
uniref:HMA domain-containing protein n=1 Tax=Leersia perrieri TaxID=77586 RepID=A0A0D9XUC0_9ORYZ